MTPWTWLLTVAVVGSMLWTASLFVAVRRMAAEAASIPAALDAPDTIRYEARPSRHLLFRFGPGARVCAELEALGFSEVVVYDECAGAARIPVVGFVSGDGRVRGSVGLWRFLPLGQIRAFPSFLSKLEDGTLIHTGGPGVQEGPGLVSRPGGETTQERWSVHQALLAAHPPAVELDVGFEGFTGLSREFYEVQLDIRRNASRSAAPFAFVDGRAAAQQVGLKQPSRGLDPATYGRIAAVFLFMAAAFAISRCDGALAGEVPEVRTLEHKGDRYHVVTVDLREHRLDLFGQGTRGQPRTIGALDTTLERHGLERIAATNAGIFQPGHVPGGLHVEDGVENHGLNLRDGEGNFHLMPNGVFYVDDKGAHVVDSTAYAAEKPRIATQSGPALLLEGEVHPAFREQSPNQLPRNGVGVSGPHTVHLVMSEGSVRFHDMATLFRDVLDCSDALYLDGVISGIWAPGVPVMQENQKYAGFLVVTRPAPTR